MCKKRFLREMKKCSANSLDKMAIYYFLYTNILRKSSIIVQKMYYFLRKTNILYCNVEVMEKFNQINFLSWFQTFSVTFGGFTNIICIIFVNICRRLIVFVWNRCILNYYIKLHQLFCYNSYRPGTNDNWQILFVDSKCQNSAQVSNTFFSNILYRMKYNNMTIISSYSIFIK